MKGMSLEDSSNLPPMVPASWGARTWRSVNCPNDLIIQKWQMEPQQRHPELAEQTTGNCWSISVKLIFLVRLTQRAEFLPQYHKSTAAFRRHEECEKHECQVAQAAQPGPRTISMKHFILYRRCPQIWNSYIFHQKHKKRQTFCSADRFQVESQLFHTHPAHLIVLNFCCTAQAHRLHVWDLRDAHREHTEDTDT